MLGQPSFADILSDMNNPESQAQRDFSPGWESILDPQGMAQLLGELQVSSSVKPRFPRAYASFKARPPRQEPRKPHMMNVIQAAALTELRRHYSQLSDTFTAAELKTAFRHCALKTHPDRGGLSETFQLVKKSYHILEALVKNEP